MVNLKEKAKALKREIPLVFLALKDEKTPLIAKVLASVTVAYALSPIDLIPDFIPVLGYLDDVLLLPSLIYLTLRLIPKEIIEEMRIQLEQQGDTKRIRHWWYALPIVVLWGVCFSIVIKWIFK